jgi:hypothetical protein
VTKNSEALLAWVGGFLFGIGLVLAILWVVWLIWCAAVPAFFPAAPLWLAAPSYWAFVGIYTLIRFLGRAVFGGSSTKE